MPKRRTHCLIYIPGLGDARVTGQRLAVRQWRWQGVEPYLFRMNWINEEPFEIKLNRLLRLIERLHGEGKIVSLVAASAGASVALAAFAARPKLINGVGCICGKVRRPEGVSDYLYQRNRAFQTTMRQLPEVLARLGPKERARIISLKPLADESVPPADTYIEGAQQATMPIAGHFAGIAYGLTLGSPRLIRFLKRTARQTQ